MSSFVPINVAEDSASSKKELEEEHTREIQVEQAFSTFQKALACQKQGQLLQANGLYEELFTLTVVGNHYFEEEEYLKGIQNGSMNHSVDGLNYLSQNVKLLRYLIFRNRGFLHLDLLLKGPDMISQLIGEDEKDVKVSDKAKELFYTMLEDLTAAIIYQEGDEEVLELLYEVFMYLGSFRLVRFTLEYRLSGIDESDDVLAFLPIDSLSLKRYQNVLSKLHELKSDTPFSEIEIKKINAKFSFLDGIKAEFNNQQNNIYRKQTVKVQLPASKTVTWLQVAEAVDIKAKQSQDKKKIADIVKLKLRYADPYLFSETPQDIVDIEIPPPSDLEALVHEQTPELEPPKEEDQEMLEPSPEIISNIENTEQNDSKCLDSKEARTIQRSSKRLAKYETVGTEQVDYIVSPKDFVVSERFFEAFNHFLVPIDLRDQQVHMKNIIDYYFADEEDLTPQYILDFLSVIDDWKLSYSQCIAENELPTSRQDGNAENKKLLEILANYGNKDLEKDVVDEHKLDNIVTYESIRDALKYQSNRNLRDLKISILHAFFTNQYVDEKQVCLISEVQFNPKLMDIIREWALQVEAFVFQDLSSKLSAEIDISDLTFTASFYEIMTDLYYSFRNKMADLLSLRKSASKGSKGNVQVLAVQAIRIKSRLEAWAKLFDSIIPLVHDKCESEVLKQKGRFLWANVCIEKLNTNNWKSTEFLAKLLSEMLHYIQVNDLQWLISNYNYENIPTLNLDNVNSMISTVSVLTVFAKIVYADSGNSESISVLESILMDGELSERQSLREFLEKSPIDLKLNLWSILFDHYERANELSNLQTGYECFVKFLFDYISSEKYLELPNKNRLVTLLTICNSFSDSTSKFLESLEISKLCLPLFNSKTYESTLLILLRFFELFYLFSLHEEAAILSPRKSSILPVSRKSYIRLKSYCVQLISIILIYYKNFMFLSENLENFKEEKVCEFMRVVHEQLGARRLCDSDHGRFLKYIQLVLTSITCTPEKDLIQVLNCRYHYNISCDNIIPENHETTEVKELDAPTAEEISNFILPVFFKENPLIKPPKQDLKQLIEDLHSILGDPDLEGNEILKRNKAILNYFLDSERLSPRFFRETYYGLFSLEFEPVETKKSLATSGLYYLQALLIYSSYKIRKKSMQTRAVELESIVSLLEIDLIYNTKRLESWLILGQVYGYLVEDDLIWTSDKLTYPERKVGTANLQRRSIICYLMAINASVSVPKEKKKYYKKVIGLLLASFAKELYSACMEPMNGHAFEVLANPRFIKNATGAGFAISTKNMVSNTVCLKLMLRSLQMSLTINDEDWTTLYYFAKIHRRMKSDPKDVLDTLMKAGRLAKDQSTSADHIIEPHYALCSAIYKYVKSDALLIEDGLQYLKASPIIELEGNFDSEMSKSAFYAIVIECLNKVNNYDKKKWHHKARYRLAYIYYHEFGNVEEALKEMSLFVSVKASNKTLVLIWKPENERPGKHFCYTFEYAMFYIDLLVRERNLNSLIQMLPKLRRSNSTMIKLYNAWERLCVGVCGLIRDLLQINETFTEVFLVRLSYKKFIVNSKQLIDSLKADGLPEELRPHICFLNAVNDMKKFNNGFGPTALIDDTVVGLYICFYNYFLQAGKLADDTTNLAESPSHRPKKMAKRDVFPLTIEMLKILKREIDQILKDDLNIFNDFIKMRLGGQNEKINGDSQLSTTANGGQNKLPEIAEEPVISESGEKQEETTNSVVQSEIVANEFPTSDENQTGIENSQTPASSSIKSSNIEEASVKNGGKTSQDSPLPEVEQNKDMKDFTSPESNENKEVIENKQVIESQLEAVIYLSTENNESVADEVKIMNAEGHQILNNVDDGAIDDREDMLENDINKHSDKPSSIEIENMEIDEKAAMESTSESIQNKFTDESKGSNISDIGSQVESLDDMEINEEFSTPVGKIDMTEHFNLILKDGHTKAIDYSLGNVEESKGNDHQFSSKQNNLIEQLNDAKQNEAGIEEPKTSPKLDEPCDKTEDNNLVSRLEIPTEELIEVSSIQSDGPESLASTTSPGSQNAVSDVQKQINSENPNETNQENVELSNGKLDGSGRTNSEEREAIVISSGGTEQENEDLETIVKTSDVTEQGIIVASESAVITSAETLLDSVAEDNAEDNGIEEIETNIEQQNENTEDTEMLKDEKINVSTEGTINDINSGDLEEVEVIDLSDVNIHKVITEVEPIDQENQEETTAVQELDEEDTRAVLTGEVIEILDDDKLEKAKKVSTARARQARAKKRDSEEPVVLRRSKRQRTKRT